MAAPRWRLLAGLLPQASFKVDEDLVVSWRQGSAMREMWRLMEMEVVKSVMKSSWKLDFFPPFIASRRSVLRPGKALPCTRGVKGFDLL
jgi:hypothetical protein